MDDVTKEFLVESYENLDRLDRDFVELEKNPSAEILGSIFRAIHTIKGTCGFLGFGRLESVTHAGENLLHLLREGRIQVTPEITDALLALVDAVRGMLAVIEASGSDGDGDYAALIRTLDDLQHQPKPEAATAEAEQAMPVAGNKPARTAKTRKKAAAAARGKNRARAAEPKSSPSTVAPARQDLNGRQKNAGVEPAAKAAEIAEAPSNPEAKAGTVSDSTVRVDVGVLDKLMNLVGELVLSRNQIMQYAASQESTAFLMASQHLNHVTTELQEGVMKTRMQPIGNIWNKFPRVARDLAAFCGKQVRVEMEGADTELDRTIIEAIKDPMTHIVRNSVDHGIESLEARRAVGKPAEGTIFLRAFHEGGQVNIEMTDDGAGIDPERIKEKALQRGLITAEQAARMSERELVSLIFLPGFSTAEQVTNVSGRGVGMDVVKTNIEKINGTIDVQSKPGHGTTLKVKLPLTLAIIPALMVTVGDESYAIPQASLLELVRVRGRDSAKAIEMVHGAPVYRLRGNLLPLVYLNRVLQVESQDQSTAVNIVVLQADDRQFGLVVDGIKDSKDIVVKPLGKHTKGIFAFSGATILGDGRVALILDVLGISQSANVVSEAHERSVAEASRLHQETGGEQQALLILRNGAETRVGIPLSMVSRLEEFPRASVEKTGSRTVVQYRGEIMPLISLSELLNHGAGAADADQAKEVLQVVVYRHCGRSIGLVVDQIVDIVEDQVTITRDAHGDGILGSAVVQKRVTDILDMPGIMQRAGGNLYEPLPEAAAQGALS